MKAKITEMKTKIKEKLIKTTLPENADPNLLDSWLISLRRKEIIKSLIDNPDGKMEIKATTETEESKKMKEKAEEEIKKAGVKGTVLYYRPSGSSLHGRFFGGIEDSICIYAAPSDEIISLSPPPQKIIVDEEKTFQSDTYTRGMMLFEVGYAMSLLAQGSRRMTELIWFTPSSPFYSTNAWDSVKCCNMPSIYSLKHYYGIARGSLENLDSAKGKKNKKIQSPHKTLYHVFRCLWCAETIANGNIPHVDNEKDKSLLEQLKRGEGDITELEKKAREEVEKLGSLVLRVHLADFDRVSAGKLLVKIRKSL